MTKTSAGWDRWRTLAAATVLMSAVGGATWAQVAPPSPAALEALRQRPPQDEVIYFLLPDRFANGDAANDHGGYAPQRLVSGFDPTDTDFYVATLSRRKNMQIFANLASS